MEAQKKEISNNKRRKFPFSFVMFREFQFAMETEAEVAAIVEHKHQLFISF